MSLRSRLRYRFDNLMARGVGAQVMLLAVVTAVLVLIGTAATFLLGVRPADDAGHADSFGKVFWLTLMHSFDPGMLGGDGLASWVYLAVMLGVTLGGLFVVSALIGVLSQAFGDLLDGLRRGRSVVVERGHTVVLGWNSKVFPLLAELAEANRNQRHACVVILADRDKVEMDEEIAATFEGGLRVVTRRGDALSIDDLRLAALDRAKAVVVLAPERHADGAPVPAGEADAVVLKALLAIRKIVPDRRVHVVAELLDERTGPVARMVLGDSAALVLTGPLISRLLVQTGRQSGLSDVYGELLDFAGHEIYVRPEPGLAGVTFRDAVFRYGTSCLIGVLTAEDDLLLPPAHDRVFAAGDRVIVIAEDDDRVALDGTARPDPAAIATPELPPVELPERILVLGNSPRLALVLRELDGFMAPGSVTTVVGAGDPAQLRARLVGVLTNMELEVRAADITDRGVLDELGVAGFDHVLLLSELTGRSQEMADARTMISLLHLRDIVGSGPGGESKVPIISEILDVRNRDLASNGDRDDFIVSNRLVSLVMSQIAESPHLAGILEALLSKDGHELYVKPAGDYVTPGEVSFATVCEAALRRGEIAIGFRPAAPEHHGGATVVVNPPKDQRVAFTAEDRVIVLSEN